MTEQNSKTDQRYLDESIDLMRKPVSQRKLIWQRFLRHKLGVVGGIAIVLMIFVFVFAEFFSPYGYLTPHHTFLVVPPMITKVHFDGLQPYVCDQVKNKVFVIINGQSIEQPGVYDWTDNCDNKYPIKFFTAGDEYLLLGLFKTNIHLFGTGAGRRDPGHFFPFGSDLDGRDELSQILAGGGWPRSRCEQKPATPHMSEPMDRRPAQSDNPRAILAP